MMVNFPRYAIYYAAPRGSALDRFGADLLGYDAWSGDDLQFPNGLPLDWRELTSDPRKYGFHATLKAPFALAPGKSETELLAACADKSKVSGGSAKSTSALRACFCASSASPAATATMPCVSAR